MTVSLLVAEPSLANRLSPTGQRLGAYTSQDIILNQHQEQKMAESRKFSVHPQMIYNLITAQAGTLGKAVLENVMNAVDAKATKVTIDIDRDKIVIKDDGHGFRSLAEIEECFDVFGFPHEEGARIYGQFGIGRAQLWCFCSAVWRTNTFSMDVDIKMRGLDYHLEEDQPQVDGLTIESPFYKPMSTHDILVFKQELKELALFAQIPVIVNGEQLNNTSPSTMKWDFETDDAYIKLSDKSQLTVYNLGVMVRQYSSYQVGSGGLVVTKPGVKLALNMARNDILTAECKVWARIKPLIQKKSDEKVRRKVTKLSNEELENRAKRFAGGEVGYEEVAEIRLITDITKRGHTIKAFMTQVRGGDKKVIVSLAKEGSNLGDRAHTSKSAFVLHPDTLLRFGVETLDELKSVLLESMDRHAAVLPWWYAQFKAKAIFEADLSKAVPTLRDGYEILPRQEWTKQEKGVLSALGKIEYQTLTRLHSIGANESRQEAREFVVGLSDTAHAWTDGVARIAFNRDFLKTADSGIGGFMHLMSTMVHEYLHEGPSTGTHVHDESFYQRFHDAMNDAELGQLAFQAYRSYVLYLSSAGIKPTKKMLTALTLVENVDAKIDEASMSQMAA
jgi:hypothetical protein